MNLDVQVEGLGNLIDRCSTKLGLNEDLLSFFFTQSLDQPDEIFRFGRFSPRFDRHLPETEFRTVMAVGRMENVESPFGKPAEPLGRLVPEFFGGFPKPGPLYPIKVGIFRNRFRKGLLHPFGHHD